MSTGAIPPQVNPEVLEQTRRHINRLIEEVGRLAEGELPPSEFYAEMLKRILTAMAAPAGAVWARTEQGNLQLQFQINLREVGLDQSEIIRQSHDELLRYAVTNPQPFHLLPNSGAQGSTESGKQGPGNPTNLLLLMVPILLNNEVVGLIEVWQNPNRPRNAIPGFLQFMGSMAELATRYCRNQRMSQMVGQQHLWIQLEAYARQVHNSLKPVEVAYHVANEGRRLVECDRLSVGVRYGRKVKVEAVSGSDTVEKRSNLVVQMRKLFDAVLAWDERLVYTGTKDESLPPKVLAALDTYLAESNSKMLVCMPLRDDREKDNKRPARNCLLMECFDTAESTQQMLSRLDVVSKHSVTAMYNAYEHRRIPMRFLWMPFAKLQEGLGGKARAIWTLVFVAFVALFSLLYLVQYPLKMDAEGKLKPVTRRMIHPVQEGVVRNVSVESNAEVRTDQNLLTLYSPQVHTQVKTLLEEIGAAQEALKRLQALPRVKGAGEDLDRIIKEAEYDAKIKAKVKELEKLRQELNLVANRPGFFYVKSPEFTQSEINNWIQHHPRDLKWNAPRWTVMTSDLKNKVLNRTVSPSTPLMEIADKEGEWQVEMRILQQHIGQVKKAFARLREEAKTNPKIVPGRLEVDLLVRSDPTRSFTGFLFEKDIGGEANPERNENDEPEPVVIAHVVIDHPDIPADKRVPRNLYTSGIEVTAKIRCGDHRMGYSLFYGVWEFFYEKIWFKF